MLIAGDPARNAGRWPLTEEPLYSEFGARRASRAFWRYRPGLHVHLYLWVALVVVSLLPFLFVSGRLFDAEHVTEGLTTFGVLVIAFQALLWRARRWCATDSLGVWDG